MTHPALAGFVVTHLAVWLYRPNPEWDLVSFSPVRKRSVSFALLIGKLLSDFVKWCNKYLACFNDTNRDTDAIWNNRKIPFLP